MNEDVGAGAERPQSGPAGRRVIALDPNASDEEIERALAYLYGDEEGSMSEDEDRVAAIADLLHQAGETHHRVFAIVDGSDDDWASWYSDWLVNLSRLPVLLQRHPVRSELTYMLVKLDKDYTSGHPSEPWERYYARGLIEHFA